jgi:hypothetical protein
MTFEAALIEIKLSDLSPLVESTRFVMILICAPWAFACLMGGVCVGVSPD